MKKIPKKTLDALIYFYRMYWKVGSAELLEGMHALSFEIMDNSGLDWLAIYHFVGAIIQNNGLAPKTDNETIYEALKLFGWEVHEDKESESL